MLGINFSDVISTLQSISAHLIAIGITLAVALLLTIAINKRTVHNQGIRKLVHSQTWIAAAIATIVALSMMLFGPLNTMLSLLSGSGTLTEETSAQTKELATDIEREGIVMLKNDSDTLPLSTKKVNVFGWASTNPIYGGTGSGSMNDQYPTTSILQGMADAGLKTNTELSDFYTSYRADRPANDAGNQDWTLPEPPASTYSDKLIANAKSFSDTAVVVLARTGGECFDLPSDMADTGKNRQFGPGDSAITGPGESSDAVSVYHNNSSDYNDFEDGQGYLELSKSERDMIDLVTKNFNNVVLVYNGANTLNLNFVDDYAQIKSVLWAPPAGQTGFTALGEVLAGKVNPSGRATDTFLRDFSAAPWSNNFGQFQYSNMDEFAVDTDFAGQDLHVVPSFVDYVEDIYVGYKYYETADDEGAIDYDAVVQYPFGYGLSYTTFDQSMGDVTYDNGTVSFDVTVTNTGDVAGKDTVEVFYNPPYTNGGIEKASANLIDFEKTKELKPGESQTAHIKFQDEDMASYDADNARAYVLEAGDYGISINANAHESIAEQTVNIPQTITYSGDNHRSSDAGEVTNEFDNIKPAFETLSRADHFANFESATAAPDSTEMPEQYKETFVNASNYKNENNDSDEMPTTGAKNGVSLYQLYGKDYDDPMWDNLLDEMTFDEMNQLIAFAGYGNSAVTSINKPRQSDVDGPSTLNNNFTGVGSIGLPSGVSVANTFSKELARKFGEIIGDMAREMNVTGWYAPAMNIHRTPYAGRNFEYFSEDGVLSGIMAAQQVAGARSKGVYPFIKHFALNDQETNRVAMLCTWANEQSMREIYFKPFELAVKDGGATAVMASFNYVGNGYSSANENMLNGVLRGEWGFHGFVETDYFGGFGYQIGDQAIRSGNDAMLATIEGTNVITDHSATSVKAMRTASHNILYTAVNSWLYENGQPKVETPAWQYVYYAVVAALAVVLVGLEVLAIKRFLKRRTTERTAVIEQ
ncbi:putative beta-glucosidase A [Bifidobacterium saguini DSM 23967]|uniref:Glycoside hydrolase family 3 C-terminal domain-containing protein n=2 Tax=Bifidobacterium saguini TaxID=762210 RepID=A0ABX7SD42_9BIFI|nr:glycoside hydrolase family 3 C-terminal domain-containing protein [Bifidobacterium saguini]KFI94152.1 putative beta-glucosidase A [Bifidobacterium saguini DSM 23967]QTB90448.1 glycoside hydrolase family 3 C-terminal domain-containing protein [Bifidobacterium saguini]